MSIPVEIADLATTLEDYPLGYLLTTGGDGRIKAVTVEPEARGGLLLVEQPGRGSTSNLAANPALTLLFPPREEKGYTLLVDGTGEVVDDVARIAPATAVLHRPAAHSDGPAAPGGCGHDCKPVG